MISEVDLRDWDKVDFDKARLAVDNLDDYSRMEVGIAPYGDTECLLTFISNVEKIYKSQLQAATKHIPAILRKGEE